MKCFKELKEDIDSIMQRDPAAKGFLEVLFCYPGFHALIFYRISNWFWKRRLYFIGRLISHIGRFFTGIEIHPGAKIGRKLFIDHGMGVVIGETAEIGNNVTLYHGVTLGGVSLEKIKRHPTIEDGVVIGAGAKVLGPFKVGVNARIGANSVVIKEVPPNTTVVGIPASSVKSEDEASSLRHDNLPNPTEKAIRCIIDRMVELEQSIKKIEDKTNNK